MLKIFRALNDDPNSVEMTKALAIMLRNNTMFMMNMANATRASNIINVTIKDLKEAQPLEEYNGAYGMKSTKYKTSLLYGTKMMNELQNSKLL